MKFTYAVATAVLVALLIIGTKACRDSAVEDCHERGGKVITSPWWSEHYTEVRCIEP